MHNQDIQYLMSMKQRIITSVMHKLKSNYERFTIFSILRPVYAQTKLYQNTYWAFCQNTYKGFFGNFITIH